MLFRSLREVAGELGVFPEQISSPPLVPEEIDQEAPLPVAQIALDAAPAALVERITVLDHFMMVEYLPACRPLRREMKFADAVLLA